VRYTAPVAVGSRVRLHQTLSAAERVGKATRMTTHCVMELEGSERPAFVAELIVLFQDE
jgi:acyl dehydratase